MKAVNLEQVLRYFDQARALTGDALHQWFISRQGTPRNRIRIALMHQDRSRPQKMLLVGHRGSGKSTELNKLAEEVNATFRVIKIDAIDIVGRTNLTYEDMMLAISTQVTTFCVKQFLVQRPLTDPVRKELKSVLDWWKRVVAGTEIGSPDDAAEIGVQLTTFLGNISVGAKQSSQTREALIFQINQQMPELIRRLNWVIEQAEHTGQQQMLIIVENTDKMDLDSALSIFRDHAPTITAPKATMLYTFPIALRHSDHWRTISHTFQNAEVLPNVPIRKQNADENPDGVAFMRNLVMARMEERLIDPEALNLLVMASGGIPVGLVSLIRTSALYAIERTEHAESITSADAANAIKELRRELMVVLTREDLNVLATRHQDRQLTNDKEEQRLLYNGSLIEYMDEGIWCDVHPVLWGAIGAPS